MRKEVSLILDSLTEKVEVDFVFVSELRYKDYVIEFFKDTQDGKYYWQAEYDGKDRKLSNFNIWVTTRLISLYSEDEKGYLAKEDVVSKAKEWVDEQKRKWDDSLTEDADLTGKVVEYDGMAVKVLRKLTDPEKRNRAHLNNPDAGDYYEVEATSKALGTYRTIVWGGRL